MTLLIVDTNSKIILNTSYERLDERIMTALLEHDSLSLEGIHVLTGEPKNFICAKLKRMMKRKEIQLSTVKEVKFYKVVK